MSVLEPSGWEENRRSPSPGRREVCSRGAGAGGAGVTALPGRDSVQGPGHSGGSSPHLTGLGAGGGPGTQSWSLVMPEQERQAGPCVVSALNQGTHICTHAAGQQHGLTWSVPGEVIMKQEVQSEGAGWTSPLGRF